MTETLSLGAVRDALLGAMDGSDAFRMLFTQYPGQTHPALQATAGTSQKTVPPALATEHADALDAFTTLLRMHLKHADTVVLFLELSDDLHLHITGGLTEADQLLVKVLGIGSPQVTGRKCNSICLTDRFARLARIIKADTTGKAQYMLTVGQESLNLGGRWLWETRS